MITRDDREILEKATRNAQNFEILHSMFWTHIDRANRAAILKHFLPQPETVSIGTFCQFFESTMLRSIHKSGRSHELWDMVMKHVPEESKIDNPF